MFHSYRFLFFSDFGALVTSLQAQITKKPHKYGEKVSNLLFKHCFKNIAYEYINFF